jgi:hypothetical protein
MKNSRQLGLDELMIVNPSRPGGEALFLGEDGKLYQVQGFDLDSAATLSEDLDEGFGEIDSPELGRYFLGEDGTLYEVIEK